MIGTIRYLPSHKTKMKLPSDGHLVRKGKMKLWQDTKNKENSIVSYGNSISLMVTDSSVIKFVSLFMDTACLYVTFNSGDMYRYDNVPTRAIIDAMSADSVGKWFNADIKGKYEYVKV